MSLNSAEEGDSLFTSSELGRHGQDYFMTTMDLATRAAEWLDNTMIHLLNTHWRSNCAHVFGLNVDEMPRNETKVRLHSFILDYISTLHIVQNLNRENEGKERSPPNTQPKNMRVLVVYGDNKSYAWDTPLMEKGGDAS